MLGYRTDDGETSVSFYQTARRNIAEDSHLHTRHRENLKSHLIFNSDFSYDVFRGFQVYISIGSTTIMTKFFHDFPQFF
jgi:hypothetical protein